MIPLKISHRGTATTAVVWPRCRVGGFCAKGNVLSFVIKSESNERLRRTLSSRLQGEVCLDALKVGLCVVLHERRARD